MRWAGYVVRIGERSGTCGVLVVKPEGKRPLGMPRRRQADNFKINFKWVERAWTGLSGVGYGQVARSFEHRNGPSGLIKCGDFFCYLISCWLLKTEYFV